MKSKQPWLDFLLVGCSESGKTSLYEVRGVDAARRLLGHVQWYSPWRRYVFKPEPDMIFDTSCLNHIAEFCFEETTERKKRLRLTKQADARARA